MRPLIALGMVVWFTSFGLGCAGSRAAQRPDPQRPQAPAGAESPDDGSVAQAGTPAPDGPAVPLEPPPLPGASQPPAPHGCRTPEASEAGAIETLREQVQLLSVERWEEARSAAGQALCTLAHGMERAQPRANAALINTVRGEAERLLDPSGVPFTQSDSVRAGLHAAVTALEQLAAARKLGSAKPWLRSARSSVELVDEEDLFGLQRARIQDAFRTVSAAFAIVTATRGPVPAQGPPAPAAPPLVTVSGRLMEIEVRTGSRGEPVTFLQVQAAQGRVLVQVAPARFIEHNPIPARRGDPVEIAGVLTEVNGTPSMSAYRVKGPRGPELVLRSPLGERRWRHENPPPGPASRSLEPARVHSRVGQRTQTRWR